MFTYVSLHQGISFKNLMFFSWTRRRAVYHYIRWRADCMATVNQLKIFFKLLPNCTYIYHIIFYHMIFLKLQFNSRWKTNWVCHFFLPWCARDHQNSSILCLCRNCFDIVLYFGYSIRVSSLPLIGHLGYGKIMMMIF
jgi:hypothetical protein